MVFNIYIIRNVLLLLHVFLLTDRKCLVFWNVWYFWTEIIVFLWKQGSILIAKNYNGSFELHVRVKQLNFLNQYFQKFLFMKCPYLKRSY